jgi:subtilase family serine protease
MKRSGYVRLTSYSAHSLRERLRARLHLEPLESRTLLSAYPVTPIEARHAYGFDVLNTAKGTNDGTGTTIAVIDAYDDPSIFSDLDTFDQTRSLTSGGPSLYAQYGPSSSVLTKATPQGRTRGNSGWAQEISLDVEWAHAIAPGAHILLVEAKTNSLTNLLSAVDYASGQAGVVVVSMSWGSGEFPSETSLDSHFTNSGITYVASAGDSPASEWPAVSPNVVGVGGTSLSIDTSGNYLGETGWNSSGGGISSYESKPAFQANVPQSSTHRTSPDVGYDADPNTGFAVYDSYAGGGGWGQYGGTSAGAPQWAALFAIADQGRATPLSTSGALNGLYGLLSTSNTINTTYLHDVSPAGYDLVTGLGSPLANTLIPHLRSVSPSIVKPSTAPGGTSTHISASSHVMPSVVTLQQILTASPNNAVTPLAVVTVSAVTPPASITPAPAATVVTPPPVSTRQESGGGQNGVVFAEDDGIGNPTPLPVDLPNADTPPVVAPPANDQEPAESHPLATAWRHTSAACFTGEQWIPAVMEQLEASLLDAPQSTPVLDPAAALAGLAIVLGSYWSAQSVEPERRNLERGT